MSLILSTKKSYRPKLPNLTPCYATTAFYRYPLPLYGEGEANRKEFKMKRNEANENQNNVERKTQEQTATFSPPNISDQIPQWFPIREIRQGSTQNT